MGLDQYIQEQTNEDKHYMRKHGFMHNYIADYLEMQPDDVVWGSYELDKDFFEKAIKDMKKILKEKNFEKAMEIMPLPTDGFFFGWYMDDWKNGEDHFHTFERTQSKDVPLPTEKEKQEHRKLIEEDYFECIKDDLEAFENIYKEKDWDNFDTIIVYNASW